MRRAMLMLSLLALSLPAVATDYFVATTGSDTNSGTITQPFRTIGKAVNMVSAGDSVYVRGGTYSEWVAIWGKSGGSTTPITFSSYGSETVTINGSGVGSTKGAIEVGESSWIVIQGFRVANSGGSGILIWESSNVKVLYNTVYGSQHNGIKVSGYGTGYVNNNILIQENTVYDNVRENSDRSGDWGQAIGVVYANNVEIRENWVYENYGEGIDYIVSDNGLIVDNEVWDNFGAGIYLDNAQSTTVDRNWIFNGFNTAYYRDFNPNDQESYAPMHGIAIANEFYSTGSNPANDLRIINNLVQWTRSGIFYGNYEVGGGIDNSVIANNVLYDTQHAAIWLDTTTHTSTAIRNNIVYQEWGQPYVWDGGSGITWSHNAWWGGASSTRKNGTGDVNTNPLLVSPGGGDAEDYQLQSGSPCRNTGTAVSVVTHDHFGTLRSGRGSGIDIGMHEY